MLTQELVRELFYYHDDGYLIRKVDRNSSNAKRGLRAGYKSSDGYRRIRVYRKKYLEHRLIWLFHNNNLPKYLDHINGDRCDNRISNIRECTHSQNMSNALYKPGRSGFRGVNQVKDGDKWKAIIYLRGSYVYLGCFDNREDAAKAYDIAAKKLHGEFAKPNFPEVDQ